MEPEHDDDYQRLLSRRERLRADRQAAHAAPARIRLRMGAVVVIIAALLSWLIVSWLTSADSSGEALPESAELDSTATQRPAERPERTSTDTTDPGQELSSQDSGAPDSGTEDRAPIVVHVAGAVEHPQVVEVEAGARAADAVEAAGGLTDDAAAEGVNLAAQAVDGSFIWVPTVEELSADAPTPPAASGQHETGQHETGQPDQQGPINLNTASAQQLEELSGIGPALAERIISYRETNGGFSSLNELAAVSGIGPAIIENIADDIDW